MGKIQEEQNYTKDPPTNNLGKELNWAGWFMKDPMGPGSWPIQLCFSKFMLLKHSLSSFINIIKR